MPSGMRYGRPPDPSSLLLVGQVLRVYLPSDPSHPANATTNVSGGLPVAGVLPPPIPAPLYPPNTIDPVSGTTTLDPPRSIPGVVCDVLIRSAGYRGQMFRFVPVAQAMGYGRNDAEPWIPEGCSAATNGGSPTITNPRRPDTAARAESLDGDFVVIAFLDGNANKPFILTGLTHPGRVEKPPVWAAAVPGVSGTPKVKVIRHRGVRIEIDANGNVTIDATGATSGVKTATGTEVIGTGGQITIIPGPTQTVKVGGAAATDFVALATLVKSDLDRLQQAFDAHVHVEAPIPGSTLPPTVVPGVIPVGAMTAVAATKVKAI